MLITVAFAACLKDAPISKKALDRLFDDFDNK